MLAVVAPSRSLQFTLPGGRRVTVFTDGYSVARVMTCGMRMAVRWVADHGVSIELMDAGDMEYRWGMVWLADRAELCWPPGPEMAKMFAVDGARCTVVLEP